MLVFEEVLKKGKLTHSSLFYFYYLKAENKDFKVVASKKVSKKAVIRNKNKRRVRHALKKLLEAAPAGHYIVFVKKDLSPLSYKEIEAELSKML